MASSSGLVIPLTIFFIGTRLWAIGQKIRPSNPGGDIFAIAGNAIDIGTVIFVLSVVMLVPYMIISIMGGGTGVARTFQLGRDASAADSVCCGLRRSSRWS